MKRLNGFSEVLRGSEKFCEFFIKCGKFSVYFSEIYNPTPTPPHPMLGGRGGMGWDRGGGVVNF